MGDALPSFPTEMPPELVRTAAFMRIRPAALLDALERSITRGLEAGWHQDLVDAARHDLANVMQSPLWPAPPHKLAAGVVKP